MDLSNAQSLSGIIACIALSWAFADDRGHFPWRLTLIVVAGQTLLIAALFGIPAIRAGLEFVGGLVDGLGSSTQAGVAFVFGYLAGGPIQPYEVTNGGALFVFAFRVLPVIIVVCALAALLWHWHVLRWLAQGFGYAFERSLGLRGPPALATAATIFMGQVEGPIFIRDYLRHLSRSELFMLLAVGMTCVSGSTMVAYATILKDVLPQAAAHVLTASIASVPAGILLARIIVPRRAEEEPPIDPGQLGTKKFDGAIDAVMKGATDGLNIAASIAALLIVFVALATMVNKGLALLPSPGAEPLSVEGILGVIFAPLTWTLGVPWADAATAGQLLGVKLVLTEFTGFIKLGAIPPEAIDARTRMLMTYALCGFANVGSVGINIAGFSILVPERRVEVIGMVWRAMLAGFLATCLTAAVVGVLPAALFVH